MTNNHVQRTKNPAAGSGRTRKWALWFASIALPVAVVIPALHLVIDRPQVDEIASVIKEAGFDPLVPPNRLRGPGALYEVEGGFYRKVCDVDAGLLTGKLQKSPTQNHLRERLEKGGFSLSGNFVDTLNAKLGAQRLTSIEYRLTDVAISEIAFSDLLEIEDNLLRQSHCDEAVQLLLKANKQVCPGYAALSATTFYKVHVDAKLEAGADTKVPVIKAVKQALQEHEDSKVHIQSADEL